MCIFERRGSFGGIETDTYAAVAIMPPMVVCGKRWNVGSDDFVIPSLLAILVRLIRWKHNYTSYRNYIIIVVRLYWS